MTKVKTYSFNDPSGVVKTFNPTDGRALFDSRYSSQRLYGGGLGTGVVDITGASAYSFQGLSGYYSYAGDYIYLNKTLARPPYVIAKGKLIGGPTGVVGNTSYANNGGQILDPALIVSAGSDINQNGAAGGPTDAHGFFTVAGTDRIFFGNINFNGVVVSNTGFTGVYWGNVRVYHAIYENMV